MVQSPADIIALAAQREEEAADLFFKHDKDANGVLGFRELSAALRDLMSSQQLSVRPNMETLEAKFAEADEDGDHKVSYAEFVVWYNDTVEWAQRIKAKEKKEVHSARKSGAGRTDGELSHEDTELVVTQTKTKAGRGRVARQGDIPDHVCVECKKALIALLNELPPHLSETEETKLRTSFMQAIQESFEASGVDWRKSGVLQDRVLENQQNNVATALMGFDAFKRLVLSAMGDDFVTNEAQMRRKFDSLLTISHETTKQSKEQNQSGASDTITFQQRASVPNKSEALGGSGSP